MVNTNKNRYVILKVAVILLILACLVVGVYKAFYSFNQQKGLIKVEVYDELTNAVIDNANLIIIETEEVYKTDKDGSVVLSLNYRPNVPKETIGYTMIITKPDYLPLVIYNIKAYPTSDINSAPVYRFPLKLPEKFSNTTYDVNFLPFSTIEMEDIINYYTKLVKE